MWSSGASQFYIYNIILTKWTPTPRTPRLGNPLARILGEKGGRVYIACHFLVEYFFSCCLHGINYSSAEVLDLIVHATGARNRCSGIAKYTCNNGTSAVAFLGILLARLNSKLVYDLPESGGSVTQL